MYKRQLLGGALDGPFDVLLGHVLGLGVLNQNCLLYTSVQGAWFATPYWGFGGRMSCTNLRVKVNGVAQNDNLECASMYAGPYFSHPFSMRWLVGAKLLGGCEIYKPCRTDFRRLERRAGFSFGTGLSTTYLATQNLGVRFSTDYDVAPPVVRSSRERLHKLTFGMEVCAVF